jgi:PmbA protein
VSRGGEQLLRLCKEALASAGETDAEIWTRTRTRGCARFSIGELAQHMGLDEAEARVRVAKDGRVAEVATSDLSRDALVQAIRDAAAVAPRAARLEGFDGFAPAGAPTPKTERWSEATAAMTDDARAEIVAGILTTIRAEGLVAAGMLETGSHAVAVATTRGCGRSHDGTIAELRVWALEDAAGKGSSGHGSHLSRDVTQLDVERETRAAIEIAKRGMSPGRVEAGTWDVVMEPPAVAELLEWLAMIGAGAPEVEQGTSFLAGRLGQRITGDAISIVEDPLSADEGAIADPFDREGAPRERVAIVEGGAAKRVLYDRVHAARAGVPTTGSALVPDFGSPGGVGAVGLSLRGGDAESATDARELIGGMDRGLYIRRLNYVNGFIEPRRAVMTGLSRDGCFLVENGVLVRGVGNVRMTDSFLEMLARADAMTRSPTAVSAAWTSGGAFLVPAVRFRAVRFTSGSRG